MNWNRVDQVKPPEGVLIDTISPGGMEQRLRRKGSLFFYPDMLGYIYYVPEFWRLAPAAIPVNQ